MKTILRAGIAVLGMTLLSGCNSVWERHPGTESQAMPDQTYWSNHQWRKDITKQWSEDQQRLSRIRLSEFIH